MDKEVQELVTELINYDNKEDLSWLQVLKTLLKERNLAKADNGEQVLIRRKNEIYALVKVGREDLMITPELQARIDKAREEIKSGKCVTLKSSEDIDAYFDSL